MGCETQNFRSYKNRHWNSMIQEKTLISDTFRIWQLLDKSFFFPQVLHLLNRHKNRLFKFVTEHINICSSPISTTFSIQTHKRVRIFRQLCKLYSVLQRTNDIEIMQPQSWNTKIRFTQTSKIFALKRCNWRIFSLYNSKCD